MGINKDELRELIEDDLFGDGDFSLDDIKPTKEPAKEPVKEKEAKKTTTINIELEEISDHLADIEVFGPYR